VDFGYNALFRENRFIGGDRIGDANQITAAITSRLVESDSGLEYNASANRSRRFDVAARYAPQPGRVLNAAYRFARDEPERPGIKQVDLSAQWPIAAGLTAVGRYNWSLKDSKLIEGLAGFEYNAGCWEIRAVAHRFITATQQVSTSFQVQLELSGLSRIGINPLETLRQNISGYRRSDEISR
jgi:LPS-assembly protein